MADPVYAKGRVNFGLKGQALHAHELILRHPITDELMHFQAPLPEWFEGLLTELGAEEQEIAAWRYGEGLSWPEVPALKEDSTINMTADDDEEIMDGEEDSGDETE